MYIRMFICSYMYVCMYNSMCMYCKDIHVCVCVYSCMLEYIVRMYVRVHCSGLTDTVMCETTNHTGPVRCLDVNPFQSNLLVSGASDSEIYIWDLNNPSTPMSPGSKTQVRTYVHMYVSTCTYVCTYVHMYIRTYMSKFTFV